MEVIPIEVTTQILSMLPARFVLRCRSVCKTWRNLIDEPRFAALHLDREMESPGNNKPTRFFLRPFNDGGDDCYDDLSMYLVEQEEDSHMFNCTKMPLSLPDTILSNELLSLTTVTALFYVCNLRRVGLDTFICNPFTGQFATLPKLHSQRAVKGLVTRGFGYDKSNGVFKVVQMFYPSNLSGTEAYVFTLGSNSSWRKLENAPSAICRRSAVAVNGHLHWLPNNGTSIFSFDLESESFGVIPVPEVGHSLNGLGYVTHLDGCLSIVDLNYYEHIEVWVMKDYGVSESWTKFVVSRAHLENGGYIMSIQPISFWKKGEILSVSDSKTLVSYNVESGRYTPLDINRLPGCGSYEAFPYCGSLLPLHPTN